MHDNLIYRDAPAIKLWLLACLMLVAMMVVLGGYTRLSGSGLSITEWKPVHGVIPPISAADWQEEFEAYRQTPQYQKINRGMALQEFKVIFWPEYLHRLLGRATGIVFLLPLLVFAWRRSLSRRFGWRLFGIFALGGVQGIIGWYMVKSGLVDDPHVSHIRLALHLSVAFAIFGLLLWSVLGVASAGCRVPSKNKLGTGHWALGTYLLWFTLLAIQIILGAFVAGLKAGLVYNSWPLMNGEIIPAEAFVPPWHENLALIQFLHRWLAVFLVLGLGLWWYFHRSYVSFKAAAGVMSLIVLQFALGVLTLVNVTPLALALMHQAVALLLFAAALILWRAIARAQDHSQ